MLRTGDKLRIVKSIDCWFGKVSSGDLLIFRQRAIPPGTTESCFLCQHDLLKHLIYVKPSNAVFSARGENSPQDKYKTGNIVKVECGEYYDRQFIIFSSGGGYTMVKPLDDPDTDKVYAFLSNSLKLISKGKSEEGCKCDFFTLEIDGCQCGRILK